MDSETQATRNGLEALAPDLWVAQGQFTVFRGDIGLRMTVIRCADGSIWIHSPIPFSEALAEAVRTLGEVRWLVAPNKVHHLYLGGWIQAFPEAQLAGAPGLAEKRKDLRFDARLDDGPPAGWPEVIQFVAIEGSPTMNEVVFFHAPSGSVLFTDLVFNTPGEGPNTAPLFNFIVGSRGRFGPHRMIRSFFRDKRAVARGIDRVLQWDFDRVIVTHGDVLETGGREKLRAAFAYLPR